MSFVAKNFRRRIFCQINLKFLQNFLLKSARKLRTVFWMFFVSSLRCVWGREKTICFDRFLRFSIVFRWWKSMKSTIEKVSAYHSIIARAGWNLLMNTWNERRGRSFYLPGNHFEKILRGVCPFEENLGSAENISN